MRIQDNFVSVVNDFFKFLIDQKKMQFLKKTMRLAIISNQGH